MNCDQMDVASQRQEQMQAMKSCLDQLVDHAESQGWILAANLIGAASRAISDELVERAATSGASLATEVDGGKPE